MKHFLEDDLAATPHDVASWFFQGATWSGVVTETWQILYFVDGKTILEMLLLPHNMMLQTDFLRALYLTVKLTSPLCML